jgi:hypothetical protein
LLWILELVMSMIRLGSRSDKLAEVAGCVLREAYPAVIRPSGALGIRIAGIDPPLAFGEED